MPVGQAGGNDYAKWKYTLAPAYAGTIREGINRITAKLVCQANPTSLTKFYSINVTGMNRIVPKQSAITRSNTSASLSSNSSSSLFYQTPLINHLSLPTNSNSSASIGSNGTLHRSIYGEDHHNGMSSHYYHSTYGKGHPNLMGRSKHNDDHCTYSDYKRNVCG
jgi:hypothetical protein